MLGARPGRRRRAHLHPDVASEIARRAAPIDAPRPRRLDAMPPLVDPAGSPGPTLVLFLSSGCDACDELAELVPDGVDGHAVWGVLRESDAPGARRWGGEHWVVSDRAFEHFDVGAGPFFCLVERDGTVRAEGVALGAAYVVEQARRAAAGLPSGTPARLRPSPER